MEKEKLNELISIALGAISVLAIIGLLINNGFETNELLGSIINFTQVAIPVLVLIVLRMSSKRLYGFLDAGRDALIKLQRNNKDDLEGPRANSQKKTETPEEQDRRNKYLFIKRKNDNLKTKVTFIPLNGLEDGVLDIRVSKATLVNNNFDGTDEEISELQTKVHNEIKNLITSKLNSKLFEIFPIEKKSNSAINIDFDESELGTRKYKNIIYECGQKALEIILSHKK